MRMAIYFIGVLLLIANALYAQIDTTIKLDLLKAPSSPAAHLLGISPSDIEKPSDVSAFMMSLQSAATSIIKSPLNYAIDIAPYWLFSKKGDYTTEGLKKSKGSQVFKQTLVLSTAVENPDSSETTLNAHSTYAGFGFKFYLFRGNYDSTTRKSLEKIKRLQDLKLRHLDEVIAQYSANASPEVVIWRQKMKDMFAGVDLNDVHKIDSIRNSQEFKSTQDSLSMALFRFKEQKKTEASNELDKEIQSIASSFQTARVGFTWDLAGGVSAEFVDKNFNRSKVNNAGLWSTMGYSGEKGHTLLAIVRFLYNPEKIFAKDNVINPTANISTLDGGVRYIYSKPQAKFSGSVEAIYRSVLSSSTIDPSWRLVLNAEYAIWQNQKLTFSFGRNFDGLIYKDGNLIAALTFLTGFGNKR